MVLNFCEIWLIVMKMSGRYISGGWLDPDIREKIPSEMGVAPPHKRFTQFSALIKL